MMNLSFKDTQFIIEAIDNLIDNYQERIEAIQDIDEDEASDLGNDCMFLECLRQDLAKSVDREVSAPTLGGENNSDRLPRMLEFPGKQVEEKAERNRPVSMKDLSKSMNFNDMKMIPTLEEALIPSLIQEIEQTPPEYWPNLLEMIRLFCKSVTKAQQMKLTGIKHGNTIELSENPNIPDGTQVVVEVKQVETKLLIV